MIAGISDIHMRKRQVLVEHYGLENHHQGQLDSSLTLCQIGVGISDMEQPDQVRN